MAYPTSNPLPTSAFKKVTGNTHADEPEERRHVESNYLKLPFPFEPLDFPDFFIHKDLNFDEMVDYIRTWSAYKNAQTQEETNTFETFFTQLEQKRNTIQSLDRFLLKSEK